GLVNSTATVAELAERASNAPAGPESQYAPRAIMLATTAMLLRNAVILGAIALPVLTRAGLPLALMFAAAFALVRERARHDADGTPSPVSGDGVTLQSPFSLKAALKFGAILLALHIGALLAERAIGS